MICCTGRKYKRVRVIDDKNRRFGRLQYPANLFHQPVDLSTRGTTFTTVFHGLAEPVSENGDHLLQNNKARYSSENEIKKIKQRPQAENLYPQPARTAEES